MLSGLARVWGCETEETGHSCIIVSLYPPGAHPVFPHRCRLFPLIPALEWVWVLTKHLPPASPGCSELCTRVRTLEVYSGACTRGPDTLPHNIHGWDGIKTYHLHLHLTCYIHNPICCTIPICRHQYFVSMESLSQNGEFSKVMCCSSLEACSGLKSHFSVQL